MKNYTLRNNPQTFRTHFFAWLTRLGVVLLVPVIFHCNLANAAETARSADDFVDAIGVNTHLGYYDRIYKQFDTLIKPRLLELGVRHIRDGTFNTDVANKYLELGQHGIKVLLITNPKKASEQIAKIRLALWAIEGVNEPDAKEGWVERIRAEQKELYAVVKSNPTTKDVPVLVSSLANIRDNPAKLGDLTASLDFGNMHPYAAGQAPSKHMGWGLSLDRAIGEARKVSTTKPLVVTECGYHNRLEEKGHPGCTETAMGKYLPRLLAIYFMRGMVRSYTYEFADEKADPEFKDKEMHFGLVRHDGSVKPAFTAVKHLIHLLKDPGPPFTPGALNFTLSGNTNHLQHLLLQKRNGTWCLLLWQEVTSYDTKTHADLAVPEQVAILKANPLIKQARIFRPNQTVQPLKTFTSTHELTVSVPDEILLVELRTTH